MARPGHEFVRWEGCDSTTAECSFDVSADIVHANWLKTAPPLVAIFAAIQQEIFDGKGCAGSRCHGENSPQAGMSLASGRSFASTVGVASTQSNLQRIRAGDAENSYLYRKVAAKTRPGSVSVSGSPMPLVGSALSEAQLAALALWIDAGAPTIAPAGSCLPPGSAGGWCVSPAPSRRSPGGSAVAVVRW